MLNVGLQTVPSVPAHNQPTLGFKKLDDDVEFINDGILLRYNTIYDILFTSLTPAGIQFKDA